MFSNIFDSAFSKIYIIYIIVSIDFKLRLYLFFTFSLYIVQYLSHYLLMAKKLYYVMERLVLRVSKSANLYL